MVCEMRVSCSCLSPSRTRTQWKDSLLWLAAQARDTVEVAGRAADAASAAAAAAPAAAEKAIQLLKRPGAKALWAVAVVPDAKGKANLLRGANKALCASVAPPGGKAVAIVGNGPLADASRQEIAAADAIVRFNEMNNRRCLRASWPFPFHLAATAVCRDWS